MPKDLEDVAVSLLGGVSSAHQSSPSGMEPGLSWHPESELFILVGHTLPAPGLWAWHPEGMCSTNSEAPITQMKMAPSD